MSSPAAAAVDLPPHAFDNTPLQPRFGMSAGEDVPANARVEYTYTYEQPGGGAAASDSLIKSSRASRQQQRRGATANAHDADVFEFNTVELDNAPVTRSLGTRNNGRASLSSGPARLPHSRSSAYHLPFTMSSLEGTGSSAPLSMDDFLQHSRFSPEADDNTYRLRGASNSSTATATASGAYPPASTVRGGFSAPQTSLLAGHGRRFDFPSVAHKLPDGHCKSTEADTAAAYPLSPPLDSTKIDVSTHAGEALKTAPLQLESYEPHPLPSSIAPSVAVSVFGGAIYGYTTAIIAGLSNQLIQGTFFPSASSGTQSAFVGLLTASILIGAWAGSLLSIPLTARLGRKWALVICGSICVAASVVMGFLDGFAALLVVRTVLGLSVGMTVTTCPLYNAEMVTPQNRGVVGAVYQLSIVTSILIAEIVNYAFNPSNQTYVSNWVWQVQFLLGTVWGAGLLITGLAVPESGVWMVARQKKIAKQQRELVARRLLLGRRPSKNNEQDAAQARVTPAAPAARTDKGWSGLCRAVNSHWILLATVLAAGNQLTGINAIMYYAPRIFVDAGFESKALVLTIAVVGTWNLVSVLISMPLIRIYPRRTLMLVAAAIMSAGMCLIMLASIFLPDNAGIPSIIAILLVVVGFELGPGPLFFVLAAEAFPSPILHAGLSLSNQLAWLCNIAVTFLFPLLNSAIGTAGTFGVFLALNLLTLLAYFAVLPEHAEHATITAPSPSPTVAQSEMPMTKPMEDEPQGIQNGAEGAQVTSLELSPPPQPIPTGTARQAQQHALPPRHPSSSPISQAKGVQQHPGDSRSLHFKYSVSGAATTPLSTQPSLTTSTTVRKHSMQSPKWPANKHTGTVPVRTHNYEQP